MIVSAVPATDALATVGTTPSTLWSVLAATAACASAASVPAAERSVPPFFSSVFTTTATPALEASPAATAYSNTSAVVPLPESYPAQRSPTPCAPPRSTFSRGVPPALSTVTAASKVTRTWIASPSA